MSRRSSPEPRRALRTELAWVSWLSGTDPDCPDEYDGDRNGEPAEEDYDLGCVVLAAIIGSCLGATAVLLVLLTLR